MLETRPQPHERTEATAEPRGAARDGRIAAALLAAFIALSAGLRLWAGLRIPSPWYTPDELVYGELGRSLYALGRFDILGGTPSFYGLVYPALVGLPLSLSDRELGYDLLKVVQAVVMSLTALPVYLWGRSMMRPALALSAAALTLAAPALAFTGFIMTEVAFYPVVTLAAWACARALVRPTLANQALVVAAVVAATLTRLQAIVLLPGFVLALAFKVAFDRSWLRGARPFVPVLAVLGALAVGWVGTSSLSGGAALGAYTVTGKASYSIGDALRFSLYHAGDLVLLTAVVPVAALIVLAVRCAAGREPSEEARAYVAVAAAFSLVTVGAVGLFTSRFLGRLAERNLVALAPIVFLALALWLERGAPRPRLAVAAACGLCLGLLLYVPWNDFVTAAAEPDALSVIPLFRLRTAYPDLDMTLIVAIGALELLAAFAFLSRRLLWLLPVVLIGVLACASVVVSDEVTDKARGFHVAVVGADNRWIDSAAKGPVAYVYGNEQSWSAGAPAWMNTFWNDKVESVYALFGAPIAGPMPERPVRPTADGRLLSPDGRPIEEPYAVLSRRMSVVGDLVAVTDTGMALWRARSPLRLSTRTSGFDSTGVIAVEGRFIVYDCRGGTLRVSLRSPVDQTVDLLSEGKTFRTVRLRAGTASAAAIPAPSRAAPGKCTFKILVESPLRAERLEFDRAA